eukprot:750966-Hanusia_phi.AAC.1
MYPTLLPSHTPLYSTRHFSLLFSPPPVLLQGPEGSQGYSLVSSLASSLPQSEPADGPATPEPWSEP